MSIEVAILTKSSKHKGYCVAGINMNTGNWVRLTSNDESSHGALTNEHMIYENKKLCKLFDLVRVEIQNRNPTEIQPENYLIDEDYYWTKIDECTLDDILEIHPPENNRYIFGNAFDYVTESEIRRIGHSLTLVEVDDLVITKTVNSYGSPKTKANFSYGPIYYNHMSVTDPTYYNCPNLTRIGKAILVISLPDSPFPEDRYYKFVAQIFPYDM